MRYRLFGPTGLRVSELALGAMTFGEAWGRGRLFPVERNFAIAGALKGVAEAAGCSMPQAALAWIRHKDPSIIPIVGTRKLSRLEDDPARLAVSLDDARMQALEGATAVDRGVPADFLGKVRRLVLSGVADRIDSDRTGY